MNIPWRACAFAALPLLMLGFAACSGDDDDDGASSPAAGANGDSYDTGVPAGAPEIDQDNLSFKPKELTVKASETVYFRNSESALHTVTIDGKNQSGNMKKGDVFSWAPPAAGTYKISCDFHPQMKATVTVQ